MTSTKCGVKCRKPSKKDYMQAVGSENRRFAHAHVSMKIDENNDTASVSLDPNVSLFDRVLAKENLNAAYLKVKENDGAGGIDGMGVDGLFDYLHDNQTQLLKALREGKFKPNPVRRVEIPKDEAGKFRTLGIPTVVDRVIQQAIAQVLTPIYEYTFSDYSYGFRPGRDCHLALWQVQEYANEGYVYAVDIDLEKYFDTVCHSKLMQLMSDFVKDGRLLSLIHKYLNAGALEDGLFLRTDEGVPQGGPLSPLLGNIDLDPLDKELERRGHKFVRYADDVLILCKSERAANRVMESITEFIEGKLFLKVNREKSQVVHLSQVKYLGYGFYFKEGECRLKVHKKSLAKLKLKLREGVLRRDATSNTVRALRWRQKVMGWINYFKLADMGSHMRELDGWSRRHIRAIYWRQWKRVRTRYKVLKKFGVTGDRLHKLANMRCGPWRAALALNSVLTNQVLINLGFISMSDYYLKVRQGN